MSKDPTADGHDDLAYLPPAWPDDGLRHRIQLVVEVSSGPGLEITAAELLLGVLQTLHNEGVEPATTALRITTSPRRGR